MLLKSVILHGTDNFTMIIPKRNFMKRFACDLDKRNPGFVNYLKMSFTLSEGVKVRYNGEMVTATEEILADCFPVINGVDFIYSDGKGWKRHFGDIKTDKQGENTTILRISEDEGCLLTVNAYKGERN